MSTQQYVDGHGDGAGNNEFEAGPKPLRGPYSGATLYPSDIPHWVAQRFRDGFPIEGGCAIWTGAKSGSGYGKVLVNGRQLGAHRVAYALAWGEPLQQGRVIHHTCGRLDCVNPLHLQQVTQSQNLTVAHQLKKRLKKRANHG